nr:cytochrome P450 [Bacteriovorax sp. HI3]
MNQTRLKSPPKARGNLFLGNLFQMKDEGVQFYPRMARLYGDAITARIGWKSFYLFFHPDHIKEVLQDKSDIYIKGDQYNQLRHLMGTGLLTSEGKDWEKQRRMLNPIFGKNGLDILLVQIKKASEQFVARLEVEQELDWSRKMFDFALEVAVTSFFGSSLDSQKMDQMAHDMHICMRFVSRRMTNLINVPLSFPVKEHVEFKSALKRVKTEIEKLYDNKIQNKGRDSKDMLDLLIAAEDEDKLNLSREEVFDQVMSFLIAGHETTAITMSWFYYLLAKKPEYQERLIKELESGDYKFETSNELGKYPFLEAIINETMRLYPAGWVIARNITEDNSVGQWNVKKGHVLAVCPYVAHRDPRWWKNPDDFMPERFLDSEVIKNLPRGAFVPFSIGKRNCIGSRFSLMEITVFALEFFKHFKMTTMQKEVGVKGYVTLKTDRPVRLTLHKK